MDELGHYFGPADRSLFGVIHWPTRARRAGVVICPPIGYELVCAHHGLRILATRLAALGHPVLRLDYDGTGNSIGDLRSDEIVDSWVQSVSESVAELRRMGVDNVVLVGLRLGATLAAMSMSRPLPGVCGVVLWDPVASGRRYVRSLQLMTAHSSEETGIVVGGVEYPDALLAELRRSGLPSGGVGVPTLLITRPGLDVGSDFVPSETKQCDGMEEFLDRDAELSVAPQLAICDIAEWVHGVLIREVAVATEDLPTPTLREVAREYHRGTELRHRVRSFGDAPIFGVETRTEDPGSGGGRRAIVFMNNGVAPQTGPARAWVAFGRDCAMLGWRVVRMDVSGIGNSPPRNGAQLNDSYPLAAGQDVRDVVDGLELEGIRDVVVVGLCSGSLLAYDASKQCPAIRAIIAINGRFDRPFTDGRSGRSIRAAQPTNRLLAIPLHKAPLFPHFSRVPTVVWQMLSRLRLVGAPSVAIAGAAKRGVASLLIFGPDEFGKRALEQRDGQRFSNLCKSSEVQLVVVPGLDHSMFSPEARAAVWEVMRDYLESEIGVGTEKNQRLEKVK